MVALIQFNGKCLLFESLAQAELSIHEGCQRKHQPVMLRGQAILLGVFQTFRTSHTSALV